MIQMLRPLAMASSAGTCSARPGNGHKPTVPAMARFPAAVRLPGSSAVTSGGADSSSAQAVLARSGQAGEPGGQLAELQLSATGD
jgi:hypothetical protein